jgi:hypothetical protein
MLPADERLVLEAKFRRDYENGLLIVPEYCSVCVVSDEIEELAEEPGILKGDDE